MNGRISWLMVLAVAVIGVAVTKIEVKAADNAKAGSATVVMTGKSIRINPAALKPGSTDIVVINRSAQRRGFVISSKDSAGTPNFRYTPMIRPGGSYKVNYWLYPGRSYQIKDYTATRVYGTERKFDSANKAVVRIRQQAGEGRGPRPSTSKTYVTMSDNGLKVSNANYGATTFIITNKSSQMKGVVLSGKDAGGTPMTRYCKLIKPGETAHLTTWLYKGQSYKLQDYTSVSVEQGKGLSFQCQYSQPLVCSVKTASVD